MQQFFYLKLFKPLQTLEQDLVLMYRSQRQLRWGRQPAAHRCRAGPMMPCAQGLGIIIMLCSER